MGDGTRPSTLVSKSKYKQVPLATAAARRPDLVRFEFRVASLAQPAMDRSGKRAMGHHIQAIIGSNHVLQSLRQRFGESRVAKLNQGLLLLPLTEAFYDALPSASDAFTSNGEFHFRFLDSKVVALLIDASKIGPVAYVETEYFGGDGDQGAIVAHEGKIVFGPAAGDGSINAALRLIGAEKETSHDEFEAIGLGRFRSNEDWIEQPRHGR
jgi:hypothetical protein